MTAPIIYLDMVRAARARQRRDVPPGAEREAIEAAIAEAAERHAAAAVLRRWPHLGNGPEAA